MTSERLSARATMFWYGFAAVTYVAASLAEKALLNWFVGPVWFVAVVVIGPALVERSRP